MKYIWEEDDIRQGRNAASNDYAVTIVLDPFPAQEHREWRILSNRDSILSCSYSKSEVAAYLTTNRFAPF
jgi:hypothetical protein